MLHVPLRRCAIKGERIERWQRRMCKTQGCVLILRLQKGGIISPGRRLISPVFSTIIRARSSLRYLFVSNQSILIETFLPLLHVQTLLQVE